MGSAMESVEILRAACCVAGLDHQVSQPEQAMLQKLADHAGVGAASLRAMVARAERDPNFYKEQFRVLKGNADATITALFCVACADGDLTTAERVILQHFADTLKMDQSRFDTVLEAAERKVREHGAESGLQG